MADGPESDLFPEAISIMYRMVLLLDGAMAFLIEDPPQVHPDAYRFPTEQFEKDVEAEMADILEQDYWLKSYDPETRDSGVRLMAADLVESRSHYVRARCRETFREAMLWGDDTDPAAPRPESEGHLPAAVALQRADEWMRFGSLTLSSIVAEDLPWSDRIHLVPQGETLREKHADYLRFRTQVEVYRERVMGECEEADEFPYASPFEPRMLPGPVALPRWVATSPGEACGIAVVSAGAIGPGACGAAGQEDACSTPGGSGGQLVRAASTELRYAFRKKGKAWIVTFDDEECVTCTHDGAYYIAELLRRPKEPVSCDELLKALPRHAHRPKSVTADEIDNGSDAEDDGWQASSGGEAALDAEAKSAVADRIKSILAGIEKAQKDRDESRVQELQEEREQINDYLRQNLRRGGRARFQLDDAAKVQGRVRSAILRAIEDMRRQSKELGLHLDESIRCSRSCLYVGDLTWSVVYG